jgi:sugar-specific transcriptional regulator TrmB
MAQNLVLNILARDKTKQALAGVRTGLSNLRSAVFSVQSAILGLGSGLAVKSILDVGSNVEQLRLRFAFLFKGVQEGDKAFKGLIDFASRVPFTLEEIQAGAGNLAVVTKNAEELNEILQLTGNVASVTGLDFRTTAEQIQRSFSSGIGSADLFRERGVRALLGFKAGAEVTVEDTKKRFRELFGEGGEFEKATEVLSTTFAGTLSMLSDKLFKFKLETGQAGFFDFVKQGLVEVNKIIENNAELIGVFGAKLSAGLIEASKQVILGSAFIIQAIKPVFSFVGSALVNLFDFMKTLPEGVRTLGIVGFLMLGGKGKLLVLVIGAVIDKIRALLGKALEEFAEFNFKISEIRKTLRLISDEGFNEILQQTNQLLGKATNLQKPIKDFRREVENSNEGLDGTIGKIEKFLNTLEAKALISKKQIEEILSKLKGTTDETDKTALNFTRIADTVKNQIKKDLESVNETIGKFILGGVKSFSRALAESVVLGKQLKMSFEEIAKKFLVDILAFTIQIVIQKQIEKMLSDGQVKNEEKITDEKKKQLKIQGMMMMMSGNPLGILGFASPGFAQGGAVSKGKPIMVGERGPEMFIPNSTGQITQNARGGMGGAVNVNFTINTIDSRGFDQALVENRGTITSIINNALSEKGRGALV